MKGRADREQGAPNRAITKLGMFLKAGHRHSPHFENGQAIWRAWGEQGRVRREGRAGKLALQRKQLFKFQNRENESG